MNVKISSFSDVFPYAKHCFVFNSSDADIGPLSPLGVSVAAGFSGMFGAAGSHWFDTAKARSQCSVVPKVQIFAAWPNVLYSSTIIVLT